MRTDPTMPDLRDRIVVVDNYDSFVFNLARYFEQLGQPTCVVRNDRICVDLLRRSRPRAVVISPGPGRPADAGASLDIVRSLHGDVPILGVCLGHQVIVEALGGAVIHAAEPVHGRASDVLHEGQSVFRGLPSPLRVGRYHSLRADAGRIPDDLFVTARCSDGTVMAVADRGGNVVGLQFHPESILTECGYTMLANFLRLSGVDVVTTAAKLDQTVMPRVTATPALPTTPVTF